MNHVQTDVLVIGGGAAAARAAIAACDAGAGVLIASKGSFGCSGATAGSDCEIAGYNVPDGAKDPSDNAECFYEDIIKAGMGMANPELVRILAENALDSFRQLENWGLKFEKTGNDYLVMKGCFSSRPRGHIIKGHGEPVMKVLTEQIHVRSKISVMENSSAVSLITNGGVCGGALVLNGESELIFVRAKAVVMANGGASQIFLKNLNPPDVSGDGYALGHRAGAKLVNMEFMQAGIGFSYPVNSLFNTYLWAGLPKVTNAAGETFIQKYLPSGLSEKEAILEHRGHFPFSSRDNSKYIEIAVQREIAEGRGTERGGVPVSFEHFTDDYVNSIRDDSSLRELWPTITEFFRKRSVDLLRDSLEISCFAQAINGGIMIDRNAMSTVPGLFAAGETAGGPHGADRLGGNMFVTCQVFGKIAGTYAALFAKEQKQWAVSDPESQSDFTISVLRKNIPLDVFSKKLNILSQNNLLVRRTEKNLTAFISELGAMTSEIMSAPELDVKRRENMELLNKITSAKLMAQSALQRRESRGSHYREDYPATDADYSKQLIL